MLELEKKYQTWGHAVFLSLALACVLTNNHNKIPSTSSSPTLPTPTHL